MKKFLSFILAVVMAFSIQLSVYSDSSGVTITTASPWFEAGYVEWTDTSNAGSYNVYYKKSTDLEYIKIDSELVRGNRADILGLPSGGGMITYDVKVVPVSGGSENAAGADIAQITPMEYTREGFGFSPKSPHKNTTGGYNLDGSVKAGATIYYVSEETKNTIKDTIYKGKEAIECTGIGEIMAARQSAKTTDPVIVRFIGKVTAFNGLDSASLLNFKCMDNVTIEGVGEDTLAYGWGLNFVEVENIEVRNMAFEDFPDDAVSLQGKTAGKGKNNKNIWIHNNDFFVGRNGGGDKKKGDGSCDVKNDTTYVTISYNHFHSSGKTSLCGMKSETPGEGFVTYHHNWYDKSGSRHPRIRTITVHSYNNYYDHNYSGGIGCTTGASAFLEKNYFEDVVRPVFAAGQGNDIKEDGSSFSSGENGGVIKGFDNVFTTCGKSVTYLNSELQMVTQQCKGCTYFNDGAKTLKEGAVPREQPDYYKADTRDEKVPASFAAVKGGAVYTNFDTSADMYSYNPDTPAEAKAKAVAYAGRVRNLDPKKPLTAPENPLAAINADGSFTLRWDTVIGAKTYKVSYDINGGTAVVKENIKETTLEIKDIVLKENDVVRFTVSAVKADGSVGTGSSAEAKYSAPPAPSNLILTVGNANITAKWNASLGASSYIVSVYDRETLKETANITGNSYTCGKDEVGKDYMTEGTEYTVSVKAVTGTLESSAVTAKAKAVCYISESDMEFEVINDNFDEFDDIDGYNPNYEKYKFDSTGSNISVLEADGKLVVKDGSATEAVKIQRKITPIKSGRFIFSFDMTLDERPEGATNFIHLNSGAGADPVLTLTFSSRKLYINSGESASTSNKIPVGNTKEVTSVGTIGEPTTLSCKFVGDIDKKVYDLYVNDFNTPAVNNGILVLGDNFAEKGINEFVIQTSEGKTHNWKFDNLLIMASDVLENITEEPYLPKPKNAEISFDEKTKTAEVVWEEVENAQGYDLSYSINGTDVSDEGALGIYKNSYVIQGIDLKNGDILKCVITPKANGIIERNSLRAVVEYKYIDDTQTTEKPTDPTTDSADKNINYGDVNSDNLINVNDASLVLKYVLKKGSILSGDKFNKKAADVNGDNVLDAKDVSMILRKALNNSFEFIAGDGDNDSQVTEKPAEQTTSGGGKPSESTTSEEDKPIEPTTDNEAVPPSDNSKVWNLSESAFDAAVTNTVEGSAIEINGLKIYKPSANGTASGNVDGLEFNRFIKMDSMTLIKKEPTKNAVGLEMKAGDKVTVYARVVKKGESINVAFVDGSSFARVAAKTIITANTDASGPNIEPLVFTAPADGTYYIQCLKTGDNGEEYKHGRIFAIRVN